MTDKNYRNLIKAIRNSNKISYDFQGYLINYLSKIKNGTRNNDFIDEDILTSVILKFTNGEIKIDLEHEDYYDKFNSIIDIVKFMLSEGTETPEFESIKQSLIIGKLDYDKYFYSIFDNRIDYEQVINIIYSDKEIEKYKSYIIKYALEVSPYCINQSLLKKEIISYISNIKNVIGNIDEYSRDRLIEAKKRCGVYPLDEKELSLLAENARRAEYLVKELDNMQTKLDRYDERIKLSVKNGIYSIDEMSKNGLKNLRNEIDEEKKLIIERLDEYLIELEKSLKNSSDQIFNSILKDTTEKIKNIKIYAQSINNSTTDDLLRIKKAAEESVDLLKSYVQNEPELRHIIEDAAKSEIVKDALINNPELLYKNENIVNVQGISDTTPSIIIPGFDKQIIPDNQKVIIPDGKVNDKLIEAFDETIPFEKRIEKIMNEKQRREKNGELFHSIIDEVIVDIIEGDWVYLYGPSGCGKTHMFEQVAALLGIDYAENGPINNVYSVMAYTDPHGRFRATQAFIALLYGKLLSFDELDNGNPDTQVAIRVLYDEMKATVDNPLEKRYVTFAETLTVPVNPNFRLIAAGNTTGDGENEAHNAREKMDEAVQQRLTFKEFNYDSKLEEKIFGKYSSWYNLFKNFRKACDEFAIENKRVASGIVTTRDASGIVKYLDHNSKTVDQIIREKFTQKKDFYYLQYISDVIKNIYGIDNECEMKEFINAREVPEIELAKSLVYRCNNLRN